MIFLQYVDNNLADICDKSGLQGISYTEGPLCPHCEEFVLPLLWYGVKGRGKNSNVVRHPKLTGRLQPWEAGRNENEPMVRCDKCLWDSNIYELLKRKVCASFFITISHCYATSYSPCIFSPLIECNRQSNFTITNKKKHYVMHKIGTCIPILKA